MEFRAFSRGDLKYQIEYTPNQRRWKDNYVGKNNPICDEERWSEEIKYFEKGELSEKIKALPTDTGGIYMFYLKGINLPFLEHYILYIGRAQYTNDENINLRARHYVYDKRELIKSMFSLWKNDIYYRYYPDTDNEIINKNEICLIRAIVPPFNTTIPNKIQKEPEIKAF